MKLKIFNIFFALIFYIAQPISISNAVLASEESREQVKLCLGINGDIILIGNKNTDKYCNSSKYLGGKAISYKKLLSKNPNMEICYRPNYQTVFAVKTFQRPGNLKPTNKNCNQVFVDAIILIQVSDNLFVTYSQTEIDEIKEKKKAAKDKKLAKEKAAKEKRIAKEKAAKDKKLAEEKLAKKELEKRLSLVPAQTDLEKAQNFINTLKNFVKQNPDEFDIIKISEFFIAIKPISNGSLDSKLKNDLELLKQFTNSSSVFIKHYKTLEEIRINKEVKKIGQTILSLEQNIKSIKGFLINNSDSINLEQWVNDLKKAKKVLNNSNSHDELLIENERLSSVVLKEEKIIEENFLQEKKLSDAKINAGANILELKKYLKLDFTSVIAPLIIDQVKLLEVVIKKEDLKEILLANKIAKDFIFKQFEEPKLKALEEKRIADEKAHQEYLKSPENKKAEKEEERKKKIEESRPVYSKSNDSYDLVDNNVGCKSTYSKEKKVDIWKNKYFERWFVWTGEVILPEADSVRLDLDYLDSLIDFKISTQDLTVKFKEKGVGYNLQKKEIITVRFLMTGRGGCFLPFSGKEAEIIR